MGPKNVSSTGAGVWRKAPEALPDSSSVLDKFQSASSVSDFTLGGFSRNRAVPPIINARQGNPPKKPPTQIKTVCTNNLRKLFLPISTYFTGKGRTICTNCSEIV